MDSHGNEWYCLKCDEIVDVKNVTYDESHCSCGHPLLLMSQTSIVALRTVAKNPELVLEAHRKSCWNCKHRRFSQVMPSLEDAHECSLDGKVRGSPEDTCGRWQHNYTLGFEVEEPKRCGTCRWLLTDPDDPCLCGKNQRATPSHSQLACDKHEPREVENETGGGE